MKLHGGPNLAPGPEFDTHDIDGLCSHSRIDTKWKLELSNHNVYVNNSVLLSYCEISAFQLMSAPNSKIIHYTSYR